MEKRDIAEVLASYATISLSEMSAVRLMNRTDRKFVTSYAMALSLLRAAADDYYVQEIDHRRIADYYTVYFDTPQYDMFRCHACGKMNRQKLRIRSYVDSHLSFLEVKTKDNHCRTRKRRMQMIDFDPLHPRRDILFCGTDATLSAAEHFLGEHLHYAADSLTERIENRFERITLVNKAKTERLTIDLHVHFHNLITDQRLALDNVVIIELKRDGRQPSPILALLRQMRIKPLGFSKYCVGTAITCPSLPQNRLKQRLRTIQRIQHQQ